MSKRTTIGGQALIEGIMMKGPHKTVMAIRLPDGSITTEEVKEARLKDKYKILALPVLRGIVGFVESLFYGYKALMRSADISGFTEIEPESENKPAEKLSGRLMTIVTVVALILGLCLALGLFIYLPALLFDSLNKYVFAGGITAVKGLFEGIIKMAVFVLYVWAVSRTKDIKRVFMYHGAEHKTIFCYEAGLELTPENAATQKRFHPRCGTSFMILMLAVSILISSIVMIIYSPITSIRWLWVLVKLLLVPFTVGLGYELIRICGRYDNLLTCIISAPGRWLQRLTTAEPSEDMLEVAIVALKAVIPENENDDNWQ